MLWGLAVLALVASVQGRAVNISNTWVLPEEGFPVFYRYFRDRISWYEADAVCQFHHANLVTVDTTAQYDALRAYLKELDITSAVWVGLIRSNPDGDFTWTDYRGLSGDGYWSSAPDSRSAPLCAAADPTADYRWEARACGGPMVASFICELPVPQWASGNEGCMVRQLPALTILYLPESAAVQLTADCGLAGVKRVQCTGNIKREELLNNLSCGEPPEELTTTTSEVLISSITPATVTDLDVSQDETNVENTTTERVDVTQEDKVQITTAQNPPEIKTQNLFNRISLIKDLNLNIIHDNNLESNDIPKIANQNDNGLSEDEANRLEDEKHMQHKKLHNEYARLGNIGNYENIFSQPADHFVPPLVMAKARISDDMTVLSLEEKHAQQLAEQRNRNYDDLNIRPEVSAKETLTTEKETVTTTTTEITTSEKPLIMSTIVLKNKDLKKYSSSKKYNEKYADPKSKNMKALEKSIKFIEKSTTTAKTVELTTDNITAVIKPNGAEEDTSIDLSVIIQEPAENKSAATTDTLTSLIDKVSTQTPQNITATQTEPMQEMAHEVIKITILDDAKATATPIVFEITTKVPVTTTNSEAQVRTSTPHSNAEEMTSSPFPKVIETSTHKIKLESISTSTQIPTENVFAKETATTPKTHLSTINEIETTSIIVSGPTINNTTSSNATTANSDSITPTTQKTAEITETHKQYRINTTYDIILNTTEDGIDDKLEEIHDGYDITSHLEEAIDDQDSPLLSAANEPLHRPNRSRRPQQPPNRNKFNPFRILG